MENLVAVEVKSVYGNQMIYPANKQADIFTELAGKRTLSASDLRLIKALGFEVVQVSKELVV